MEPEQITAFLAIIAVIVILAIIASGYVKAPPDVAYIISGFRRKPKILIGRAGIKIPFLERKDTLLLKQITVDIKTNGYVPTQDFIGVNIDAVAKVRIKTDEEGIMRAMKNFLNLGEARIIEALTDSLQGNMREIIGTVKLKELNTDRKKFGDEVQSKAQLDMNALGIEIISCNIQRIEDENNLILALGQDNMSQIQKDASIAKAQADKDVAIAQAEAARLANDAKIASDTDIATKQNEFRIKQAELKKQSDIRQAEADAAYKIQQEEQRKTIEITSAEANIAKQEREIELKKREAEVMEQALDAEIKKKAEAEKFARQQISDAELYERQRKAEAEKFEREKEAEAMKATAEAQKYAKMQEAEGIRMVGEAEAKAIQAKGIAEAEALEKKAEAMKKYGSAAITEMIIDKLPEITKSAAEPFAAIDKFMVIDGGNGGNGATSTVSNLAAGNVAAGRQIVKEILGIDIADIVKGETYDAKVNRNINITGLEGLDKEDAAKAVSAVAENPEVAATVSDVLG